ncbi:hypothetical protein J8273_1174 [Carpediemonas membranifera]|uniref:Stalled ribosome sensor GCN1-like HEAT repeats region domain-containing protein n=1 Tax=Carpediemonas membranifera TaxID=201153 RepID=A0A8J6BBF9_9EUKA|nr:hypothetical protein J8273_1174 [Carpediemonas membranifera]|eukprot:KAG9397259.1 hypothetical protein J8273_1174 [Carpediemonas membranifera]
MNESELEARRQEHLAKLFAKGGAIGLTKMFESEKHFSSAAPSFRSLCESNAEIRAAVFSAIDGKRDMEKLMAVVMPLCTEGASFTPQELKILENYAKNAVILGTKTHPEHVFRALSGLFAVIPVDFLEATLAAEGSKMMKRALLPAFYKLHAMYSVAAPAMEALLAREILQAALSHLTSIDDSEPSRAAAELILGTVGLVVKADPAHAEVLAEVAAAVLAKPQPPHHRARAVSAIGIALDYASDTVAAQVEAVVAATVKLDANAPLAVACSGGNRALISILARAGSDAVGPYIAKQLASPTLKKSIEFVPALACAAMTTPDKTHAGPLRTLLAETHGKRMPAQLEATFWAMAALVSITGEADKLTSASFVDTALVTNASFPVSAFCEAVLAANAQGVAIADADSLLATLFLAAEADAPRLVDACAAVWAKTSPDTALYDAARRVAEPTAAKAMAARSLKLEEMSIASGSTIEAIKAGAAISNISGRVADFSAYLHACGHGIPGTVVVSDLVDLFVSSDSIESKIIYRAIMCLCVASPDLFKAFCAAFATHPATTGLLAVSHADLETARTPDDKLTDGPDEITTAHVKISKQVKKLYGEDAAEIARAQADKAKAGKGKGLSMAEIRRREEFARAMAVKSRVLEQIRFVGDACDLVIEALGHGAVCSSSELTALALGINKARMTVTEVAHKVMALGKHAVSACPAVAVIGVLYDSVEDEEDDDAEEEALDAIFEVSAANLTPEAAVAVLPAVVLAMDEFYEYDDVVPALCKFFVANVAAYAGTELHAFPIASMAQVMTSNPGDRTVLATAITELIAHATNFASLPPCLMSPIKTLRGAAVKGIARHPAPEHAAMDVRVLLHMMVHESTLSDEAQAVLAGADLTLDSTATPILIEHLTGKNENLAELASKAITAHAFANPATVPALITELAQWVVGAMPGFERYDQNIRPRAAVTGLLGTLGAKLDWTDEVVLAATPDDCATSANRLLAFLLAESSLDVAEVAEQARGAVKTLTVVSPATVSEDKISAIHTILSQTIERAESDSTGKLDPQLSTALTGLGNVALALPPADPRRSDAMARIRGALTVPARSVQRAAAHILTSLLGSNTAYANQLFAEYMTFFEDGTAYPVRWGAAWGVAAALHAMGFGSVKRLKVLDTLEEFVTEKKSPVARRDGAMMVITTCVDIFGQAFEPHAESCLAILLSAYADAAQEVKETAHEAGQALISILTAQGARDVLPVLLKAADNRKWQVKLGAVTYLGDIAHATPEVLSAALPAIVPKVQVLLHDSHGKVAEAATSALRLIGGVVKSTQVAALVPKLILALVDPEKHTRTILTTLLEAKFTDEMDSAALSLIMPLVANGIKVKQAAVKQLSIQLLVKLIDISDAADISPYLDLISTDLLKVLVDPNPDVRLLCARAVSITVSVMSESRRAYILKWLSASIIDPLSVAARQGAAAAQAYLIARDGLTDETVDRHIEGSRDADAGIAHGNLLVFASLPKLVRDQFTPYLERVLRTVVVQLGGSTDFIRKTSAAILAVCCQQYGEKHLAELSAALNVGLWSPASRLRQQCITQVTELFLQASGQDEITSCPIEALAQSQSAVVATIGPELYTDIMCAIYIARTSNQQSVRGAAVQAVKDLVVNRPRLVKCIQKPLLVTLFKFLSSEEAELRDDGLYALQDLVDKMGADSLAAIVAHIEDHVAADDYSMRRGAAIAINGLATNCPANILAVELDTLLVIARQLLGDEDEEVRDATADAVSALYVASYQADVVAKFVPAVLDDICTAETDSLLHGTCAVLAQQPNMLGLLIPILTAVPMAPGRVSALTSLAKAVGVAMVEFIGTVVDSVIRSQLEGNTLESAVQLLLVLGSFDFHEVFTTYTTIVVKEPELIGSAFQLMTAFYQRTETSLGIYKLRILEVALRQFNHPDAAAHASIIAHTKTCMSIIDDTDQIEALSLMRTVLMQAASERPLAVLHAKPGVDTLVPVLLSHLKSTSSTARETASGMIADIMQWSTAPALRTSCSSILGAYLRVINDFYPADVRVAMWRGLNAVILTTGAAGKPFFTPVTRAVLNCVKDVKMATQCGPRTAEVRLLARESLRLVLPHLPRAKQVLVQVIKEQPADDAGLASSIGLYSDIIETCPNIWAEPGNAAVGTESGQLQDAIFEALATVSGPLSRPATRDVSAQALASLLLSLDREEAAAQLEARLLSQSFDSLNGIGIAAVLGYLINAQPDMLDLELPSGVDLDEFAAEWLPKVFQACRSDDTCISFAETAERVCINADTSRGVRCVLTLLMLNLMKEPSQDIIIAACTALAHIAESNPALIAQYIHYSPGPMMEVLAHRSTRVRVAAEAYMYHAYQLGLGDHVVREVCERLPDEKKATMEKYAVRARSGNK